MDEYSLRCVTLTLCLMISLQVGCGADPSQGLEEPDRPATKEEIEELLRLQEEIDSTNFHERVNRFAMEYGISADWTIELKDAPTQYTLTWQEAMVIGKPILLFGVITDVLRRDDQHFLLVRLTPRPRKNRWDSVYAMRSRLLPELRGTLSVSDQTAVDVTSAAETKLTNTDAILQNALERIVPGRQYAFSVLVRSVHRPRLRLAAEATPISSDCSVSRLKSINR